MKKADVAEHLLRMPGPLSWRIMKVEGIGEFCDFRLVRDPGTTDSELNVRIASDAPPGRHSGVLRLAAGERETRVPVDVVIWNDVTSRR